MATADWNADSGLGRSRDSGRRPELGAAICRCILLRRKPSMKLAGVSGKRRNAAIVRDGSCIGDTTEDRERPPRS